MSKLYSEEHRALQDRFDARRMADLMENAILHSEFAPEEQAAPVETDNPFTSSAMTKSSSSVKSK